MATAKLTVHAGPHNRINCPVSTVVETPESATTATLSAGDGEVPCQVTPVSDGLQVNFIVDNLEAGQTAEYELAIGKEPSDSGRSVEVTQGENEVSVSIGGQHFTTYCHGAELARPRLYPVIGPYGDPVTRRLATPADGREMDHHQPPLHLDCTRRSERRGQLVRRRISRANFAFGILNRSKADPYWDALYQIAIGSAWMAGRDRRAETARFWINVPSGLCTTRPRPYESWTCTSRSPLEIWMCYSATQKKAASRLFAWKRQWKSNAIWAAKSRTALAASMKTKPGGKRAPWCHYSGPVNGNITGVAIMDHPDSFRHPTHWHVRNYGLMTANPFGHSYFYGDESRRGHHTLSQGESLVGIYRYYFHKGDATEGNIRERYHDFAHPPKVEQD